MRIGHVGDPFPLRLRARENKRLIVDLAQRGVNRQRLAHVHGVAQRKTDDGVRTVHAPAEMILFRRGEKFIFLGIVEVVDRLTALLLTERRHRHVALAVGVERAEVMLQAGDQRGVTTG